MRYEGCGVKEESIDDFICLLLGFLVLLHHNPFVLQIIHHDYFRQVMSPN